MTTKELSTEMLGLRGGLSMISKYTDEIHRREAEINEAEKEVNNAENKLQNIKNEIEAIKTACSMEEHKIKETESELEIYKSEYYKFIRQENIKEAKKECYNKYVPVNFGIIGYTFIFSCILLIVLWNTIPLEDNFWKIVSIFGIPAEVVFLLAGIFLYPIIVLIINICIYFSAYRPQLKKLSNDYYNEHQKKCEEYNTRIYSYKNRIEELNEEENRLDEYTEFCLKNIEDKKNNYSVILADNNLEINLIAEKNKNIYKTLSQNYSFVLSESDWDSLDMILFYLETGRAETIKEALLLVDKQKQTDQIVNAVKEANRAMCFYIQTSFDRLGTALSNSFLRLENKINQFTTQSIQLQRDFQTQSIKSKQTVIDLLEKQVTAAEIQNVLLEKSNQTSEQLINDLRYNQRFWVK